MSFKKRNFSLLFSFSKQWEGFQFNDYTIHNFFSTNVTCCFFSNLNTKNRSALSSPLSNNNNKDQNE
jgi:hypothetical protein